MEVKAYIKGYNLSDFFSGNRPWLSYGEVEEVGSNYIIAKGALSHTGEQAWYSNVHSNGWLILRPVNSILLKSGKTYTFSFDITLLETIEGKTSFMAAVHRFSTRSYEYTLKNTLERQHVVIRRTFTEDFTISNVSDRGLIISLNSLHVKIENIMLVEGNEEKPYDNGRIQVMPVIPLLPIEYQEVEYIESTGTQYIDTKILFSNLLKIETTAAITSDIDAINTCIWATSDNQKYYLLGTNRDYSGWLLQLGGTFDEFGKKDNLKHTHIVDVKNDSYINDANFYKVNVRTVIPENSVSIYLFAGYRKSSIYRYTSMKLYSCIIYDNEELVRKFVPCYRKSDGEVGLYDMVNGEFYGNEGAGEFLQGANITTLQKCNIFIKE